MYFSLCDLKLSQDRIGSILIIDSQNNKNNNNDLASDVSGRGLLLLPLQRPEPADI